MLNEVKSPPSGEAGASGGDNPQVEKPVTNQAPPPPAQPTQPAAKPKSNVAVIIIIIVVVVLALGVGGYFGWKYYGKKLFNKLTGKTTETGTTTGSGKISIKSVVDLLMYPGSKITDQKQGEESSAYKAELTLSSSDSVETIKNYYLDLIKKNNWTITRQGSSEDNNYYLTIISKDFTDEFEATKYAIDDFTTIWHKITGDNLSIEGIAITATGGSSTSTSTTTGTTGGTGATTTASYIIADSNTREISESEIINFTPWQLKVARNEIYARHGRPFVHKDLQCYFAKQSWYSVDPNFSETSLSYTENKNVATILAYEQKTNSPLLQVDSGCQQ